MLLQNETGLLAGPGGGQIAMMARKIVFEAGANGSAIQSWIEIARPLTSTGFNQATAAAIETPTAFGADITLNPFDLAIGADLKSILVCRKDADSWIGTTFKFGTLELFPNGFATLASFDVALDRCDRLAPWINAKTSQSINVTCTLTNMAYVFTAAQADGKSLNVFNGFAINCYQDEQVCAIQNRLVQTERSMGNLDAMNAVRGMYNVALSIPMTTMQVQPSAATGPRPGGYQNPLLGAVARPQGGRPLY